MKNTSKTLFFAAWVAATLATPFSQAVADDFDEISYTLAMYEEVPACHKPREFLHFPALPRHNVPGNPSYDFPVFIDQIPRFKKSEAVR